MYNIYLILIVTNIVVVDCVSFEN